MNDVIVVEDVVKEFGTVRALDHVSLAIRENEFFALLGPSGCGKTTLLRCLGGFEQVTSGRLLLDGKDLVGTRPYERPVNMMFQSYALFPHMTVARNIAFGMELQGRKSEEIHRRVTELLNLVQLEAFADRMPAQLSGGQRQRVALMRALAPDPQVLLLDEPLSALDAKLRQQMQIELKRLQNETGITFIFVTHDQEEALTMSDRVAVMSRGHILQVGSPREIYDHPAERFVANFIGETNFLDAEVASVAGDSAEVRLNGGGTLAAHVAAGRMPAGKVTVVVRPEHATIGAAGNGADLSGTLDAIVYSGVDTQFRVRLPSGGLFLVRAQNRRGDRHGFEVGQDVGVRIQSGAAQVLRD